MWYPVCPEESATIEQSGVIPYRWNGDQLEILLITRSSGPGWTAPKGHIEPNLMPHESAAKEAYEEAGVLGRTDPQPIGRFHYRKRGIVRVVTVFAMHVQRELADWPEMNIRDRNWVSLHEARWLVSRAELGALIEACGRVIARGRITARRDEPSRCAA